jgi:PST family polysaccharide transporter
VRIIGPSKFGLINFAAAFIAYFNLICDYGFNLSGTKEISIIRNDKNQLSNKFSTILSIKLILSVISFILLCTIVFLIPLFKVYWEVYLLSYGIVIGGVLFPTWFYQGIEQMRYITIIQVIVRSILIALIFLTIKEENDYIILVLLYSITHIVIGFAGLLIARFKFLIKFRVPSLADIKVHLKSGWNIFQSMIAINICTSSNTFILGLFASEAIVGYYSAADKLRVAFQGIQSVLSQTVFPYINSLVKKSYVDFIFFIKNLFKLEVSIGLTVSMILFIFSYQITDLLLGEKFTYSGELLRIISVIPFFSSLSNVFGIQIMLPLGYDKAFNRILSFSAVLHLIILLSLVPTYFATGTSVTAGITEFVVAFLTFWFVMERKLILKKN